MGELREYDFRVEAVDVDFTLRATLMSVLGYVLTTASKDSDACGFGVAHLNEHNASWVLTRLALELKRMPREKEHLNVVTWVNDVNRIMTTRNFRITGEGGDEIGAAVSLWSMIDITARHALDLRTLGDHPYMLQSLPSPIEAPEKLQQPNGKAVSHHRVVYSDIDFNAHTNTNKYLQWVIDTLPIEELKHGFIRRLVMNFIHESRYGDELAITTDGAGLYEIAGDTNPVCRIKLTADN